MEAKERSNEAFERHNLSKTASPRVFELKARDCGSCPFMRYIGGPDICWITKLDVSFKGSKDVRECPLQNRGVLIKPK